MKKFCTGCMKWRTKKELYFKELGDEGFNIRCKECGNKIE